VETRFRRAFRIVLLSSIVAVVTPALAAGLVAGTADAVKVVADAGPISALPIAAAPNAAADDDIQQPATAEPKRLSALTGRDDEAWASAQDVHLRVVTTAKR
jgi:hypothetical protein